MLTVHVGVCQRRNWPEPFYRVSLSRSGYTCVVTVNNREYQTPTAHSTETSAREGAALIAFNICRSFSANDGMYPTGYAQGGVIQGNPVPVGTGRRGRGSSQPDRRGPYRSDGDSDTTGSRSGGSSPDFGLQHRLDRHRDLSRHQSAYVAPARTKTQYSRHATSHY